MCYFSEIKSLGYILLFIAGLVIGLHTILPHQHHDELSEVEHEIQHKNAGSILDFIKLIFHEDIGEGHLEHVVVAHVDDLNLNPSTNESEQHFTIIEVETLVAKNISSNKDYDFSEHYHLRDDNARHTHTLRGPPSIS